MNSAYKNKIIIILALALTVSMGVFEFTGRQTPHLINRFLLSAMFLAAALAQPRHHPRYFTLVFIGLACGLLGDVLLALRSERAFLPGLITFLAGHLFYVAAFARLVPLRRWSRPGLVVVAIVSTLIFLYLRPHVGRMMIPVCLYILAISIMLWGAWSVMGHTRLNRTGRLLVFLGALFFYISDIGVARQVFIGPTWFNTLIVLCLYNPGQFLLAFSIGRFGPDSTHVTGRDRTGNS